MGQAKRRKQLDSTYGKFYQISSIADWKRHFLVLWNAFFEELSEETERLSSTGKTVNFDELSQSMSNWLKPKMERYQLQDRETLAALIYGTYVREAQDTLEERIALKCLIQALLPFISEDFRPEVIEIVQQLNLEIFSKLPLKALNSL